MAKGTKYSDVSFSVPEGADPLGIGVLDLGRSSYDPIETIRSGWEATRQERLIKGDRDQATYMAYMKNMPSVEGINKQISARLNKEMMEMGGLFKQQQESGGFGGFAKTPSGQKATVRLSELENKIATDVPIYKHYSDQYTKDLAVIRSGANKDKIDWELTNANVEAMQTAKNVEEFAQPFANNAGSLVVFRPEEADMIGWVKDSIDTFAPGMDTSILAQGKDPNTGKWMTTTLETKDQKRIYDSIIKGYANAPRAVKNEIQRMYDAAPLVNRQNEDGVVMEPDVWYASQFAPEYGMKEITKYTTIDDPTEKTAAPGYGIPRLADGTLDLNSITSTIQMKTPVEQESQTVKRTRIGGRKVYNKVKTSEETMDANYTTISLPLTGFSKTFEMYGHADAIDTSTGKAPTERRSSTHKAVRIDYMPVWRGPERIINVKDEVSESGDIIKQTYTLKPGKRIPQEIEEQLQGEGANFNYEPYLMTSSMYGPAIEEKALAAGLTWQEYVSRHGLTTLTPWERVKRELLVKMKSEKYDTTELESLMKQIDSQLNGIDDIFK